MFKPIVVLLLLFLTSCLSNKFHFDVQHQVLRSDNTKGISAVYLKNDAVQEEFPSAGRAWRNRPPMSILRRFSLPIGWRKTGSPLHSVFLNYRLGQRIPLKELVVMRAHFPSGYLPI